MNKMFKRTSFVFLVSLVITFFATSCATTPAKEKSEAQGLVDRARVTFDEFMRDDQYTWFHEHLRDVKGLLIYPQVLKGGFFLGGSGGTGVLVVRNEKTGSWSQPAFYTLGSVTFGLQIGGESAEVIVMAMSRKAIDSLLASSFKLGADTSVALGPIGIGAKGNITADFISFAKSKGLYAGLNLEGAVVEVRDSLNSNYYGRDVRPVDIVITGKVSNEGTAELRSDLKRAVK